MFNLLKLNYIDVLSEYSDLITDSYRQNSMIYMEHAGRDFGVPPMADIFCMFTNSGEMTIACVRLQRQDVSSIQWVKLYLKYKFKKAKGNKCYTVSKDHIDIVFYKMWWWKWAERLL